MKAATCEEEGLQTRTCATCGYVEETVTDKLGHKYSDEFTTDVEPTCTEKGSKSHHCVRFNECGSKADVTDIDPTGHDYPDTWTTVEAATCTKDGELSRTCKTCGNVETKVAEALGHKYSETFTVDKAATCTAEGSKSHHCVRCEDKIDVTVIPANGHSWGQWTTYSAPTVFKEEVQQHTCSVCSKTETSALAGTKLTPTMSVNASKVWLQIGQKTSAFKVSGLANGDSIKSYKSSNANIFTVTRKGVLKAGKNVGTAKLTITLASGVKKVIPVTVQKRQVKTWNIKNLPTKITIKKGSKYKLSPVISLITATSKFTYQSSNKKVATVTKAGKIKAVKKGKAVITVKAGTVTKKVKVTVK